MPTAQETYGELLKKRVAPALRELGFKGSGQNYRLPSDDYWALLGFQKSTSSDAGRVRFTANVLASAPQPAAFGQCRREARRSDDDG